MNSQSSSTAAPPASLIDGYQTIDGAYSEMFNDAGQVRDHWQPIVKRLTSLGTDAIARRWADAQRVIQENGVTYNVYGDPRGMHRPWALDPVPLIISSQEWKPLAEGLIQRAKLLNHILEDVYGQRTLMRKRSLPADLVFASPNFLRPCVGLNPKDGGALTLAAFDLARNPDGTWWVVSDRTQTPSGAGYALENRLIISRAFPDLFRDCGVARLARFFSRLRDSLAKMSPLPDEDPMIVVLTPGPHNETYFEHAYLARYLGFTLVEGSDLTVRDNKVYLKTLGGLQRVHVIFRRLDDSFCDPLELRGDSTLGVAGLVQAVAAGQVAIANSVGTGWGETQSIMPFLPALCRELLGEELKLPSVATWWCGQPKELAYVLDHLEELVIEPAYAGDPWQPVFGANLSKEEAETLRARIRARPHRYVAQESISLSTAPAWQDNRLSPRHVMLRAYVAATEDGYVVMPGGLARASGAQDSMIVAMQHGGGSKDTWVLADEPVSSFSLLAPARRVEVSRSGQDLPSRVADSLYWLGRYIERAENLTSLLRAILLRMTEETSPDGCPELPVLYEALENLTHQAPDGGAIAEPLEEYERASTYLESLIHDVQKVGSLRADVLHAKQLGSIVRDRLSLDAWRIINTIDRALDIEVPEAVDPTSLLNTLDYLIIPIAAFAGMSNESMTHGYGWRFLDMGRRVERAITMTGILESLMVKSHRDEPAVMEALLSIASSEMTYRSRYRTRVAPTPLLDLLLIDETNPRSVAFQLVRLESHIAALQRDQAEGRRAEDERMVLSLLASLRLVDVDELVTLSDSEERESLAALLNSLKLRLPDFSDVIIRRYLTHAPSIQSLSTTTGTPYLGEEESV